MSTAAVAGVARKTRKTGTVGAAPVLTKIVLSSIQDDSLDRLRAQRLMSSLALSATRAGLLATLIWGSHHG